MEDDMRNLLCAVTVLAVSSARADILNVPDPIPTIRKRPTNPAPTTRGQYRVSVMQEL